MSSMQVTAPNPVSGDVDGDSEVELQLFGERDKKRGDPDKVEPEDSEKEANKKTFRTFFDNSETRGY